MSFRPPTGHAYSDRDWRIVDYKCEPLAGSDRLVRGPKPPSLEEDAYFACLGAAQTFGCFCERPFPNLLSERLGLPSLNLGFGGAGPGYFLRRPELLDYARRARFTVLQVLSGRSASNSMWDAEGGELLTRRSDGFRTGAQAAYRSLMEEEAWLRIPAGRGRVVYLGRTERLRRLIAETRADWLRATLELTAAIEKPVVLFWFSKRAPDYRESFLTLQRLFADFPQLVNREMMTKAAERADAYVECVSRRGSPQALTDRFTGKPARVEMATDGRADLEDVWTVNGYYPSPEMHEDAADALAPACGRLL